MANNEIYLTGTVGESFWGEEYFVAKTVHDQLAGMSGNITIYLNSGGGIATEGQAIYQLLERHDGKITMVIDGMAASAASLIAMAGDEIIMPMGAVMLIHDPASMWTEGRGTESDHRKAADMLDVLGNAYAAIYAARSGQSVEEARAIMRAEALMDGEMAVLLGFATSVNASTEAAVAAAFDYRIYANATDQLRKASKALGKAPERTAIMAWIAGNRPKLKGIAMSATTDQAAEVTSADDEDTIEAVTPEPEKAKPLAKAAVAQERARVRRIQSATMAAKLPQAVADTHIAAGTSLELALDDIVAQWKEQGDVDTPMMGRVTAKVTTDGRDKFIAGATAALMMKAGLPKGERNEYSSLSLTEMARESLAQGGHKTRYDDKREMIGQAFTMAAGHGTSDFSQVLANVMGKGALQGWEEQAETFPLWTRKGVLSDFKPTKRVGTGVFPVLPVVPEGANYNYGTVGDRGENITLLTYGNLLRITRQAIINDDLELLGALPRKMGRAAKRTIGNLVYAVLTSNPVMSDGVALFNAAHGNLAGVGTALSVPSMSAAIAAMRIQSDAGSALNITPKYLVVPAALQMAATQLMTSAYEPTVNKGMASNPVAGQAEVIVDARLDANSVISWYLTADPSSFDTVEVAYLDGNDTPYLEQMQAWSADGTEIKVRIDAAVAPLDWRTFYRNPGA